MYLQNRFSNRIRILTLIFVESVIWSTKQMTDAPLQITHKTRTPKTTHFNFRSAYVCSSSLLKKSPSLEDFTNWR